MKLFLKKFVIFLTGFIVLTTIIAAGSLWSLRNSSFYKPAFLVNNVPEQEFDYIILGASNGLTTLNTKVIDSILDVKGLNLSMDDTALSSQYLMLQHFVKEGKQAKSVILAPISKSYYTENNNINDNDYRFLMYVNRPYVVNYYKQFKSFNAGLLSSSKWVPTLGVSYYNAELFYPSVLALFKPEMRNRFDIKGNYTYPVTHQLNEELVDFKAEDVKFTNQYFLKIKELCEIHNMQLICYFSPMKGKRLVVSSNGFEVINHSDRLTNSRYFYDDIHVNSIGRQIASEDFAKEFSLLK